MPHLVVEYSRDIEDQVDISSLLHAAHDGALKSGLFGVEDIKVRAYPCDHSLVGGKSGTSVHVTVYLLSGRDQAAQKALAELVLSHIEGLGLPLQSLSVDCRDMDRSVYKKVVR